MKKRYAILAVLGFVYLLAFPEQAIQSARDGLILWYQSVLPVLFPFMLLCALILRLGILETLPEFFYRPLRRLFGCSRCGAFTIIAGFLCGFPMGAKLTGDLLHQNRISRREAKFLYGFVNNVSPGFLLSYVAAEQLHEPSMGPLVLFPVLGGALLYGLLTARTSAVQKHSNKQISNDAQNPSPESISIFPIFDDCIYDTIRSTVKLGAYITIFCMISNAFSCLLPAQKLPVLLFLSCIEVTNGVRLLAEAALPFTAKYIAVTAVCAFGGCSALAQSIGISGMDRELRFYYIKSRVLTTLLSMFLAICSVLFSVLFL